MNILSNGGHKLSNCLIPIHLQSVETICQQSQEASYLRFLVLTPLEPPSPLPSGSLCHTVFQVTEHICYTNSPVTVKISVCYKSYGPLKKMSWVPLQKRDNISFKGSRAYNIISNICKFGIKPKEIEYTIKWWALAFKLFDSYSFTKRWNDLSAISGSVVFTLFSAYATGTPLPPPLWKFMPHCFSSNRTYLLYKFTCYRKNKCLL